MEWKVKFLHSSDSWRRNMIDSPPLNSSPYFLLLMRISGMVPVQLTGSYTQKSNPRPYIYYKNIIFTSVMRLLYLFIHLLGMYLNAYSFLFIPIFLLIKRENSMPCSFSWALEKKPNLVSEVCFSFFFSFSFFHIMFFFF